MLKRIEDSGLWSDALGLADTVRWVTETGPDTWGDAVELIRATSRVVVTGNGAAFYAGLVLEAAARTTPPGAPAVVAVPAGVLLARAFTWWPGDLPLVISSSGELRDVITLLEHNQLPTAPVVMTGHLDSTLGRAAAAQVHVPVASQQAVTHTRAWVGNVTAALLMWSRAAGVALEVEFPSLADRLSAAVQAAPDWARTTADQVGDRISGIALAGGAGWPSAAEIALLLKEIGGLAIEGLESREAGTSGMYALSADSVVVSAALPGDESSAEAECTCAETGAAVLRLPSALGCTPLELPVLSFPAALALAAELGRRRGRDIDQPEWVHAYYRTARKPGVDDLVQEHS